MLEQPMPLPSGLTHPRQPFEADEFAPHAELLGFDAADGDELAGTVGVAGGIAPR